VTSRLDEPGPRFLGENGARFEHVDLHAERGFDRAWFHP
jgi:hypothetical protein